MYHPVIPVVIKHWRPINKDAKPNDNTFEAGHTRAFGNAPAHVPIGSFSQRLWKNCVTVGRWDSMAVGTV